MKSTKWDAVALLSLTLTGLVCHWLWNQQPPPSLAFYYASTAVAVTGLVAWSAWLWPRVGLWLTKFFCVAAAVDLLGEGLLQPFHGHTLIAKLTCQMTLFAVYAVYLAALRPLDAWLSQRRSVARTR